MAVDRQNRTSRSDIGLGMAAIISRSIQSGKNALLLAFLVWLPIWAALLLAFIHMNTSEFERYMGLKYVQARLLADELPMGHVNIDFESDQHYVLPAKQLYDWPPLKESAVGTWRKVEPHIGNYAITALFLSWFVARLISGLGRRLRGDHRLRGGRLVNWRELRRELRKRRLASKQFQVGQCPIVKGSETENTMVLGSPGVGKSVLILDWLDQLGPTIPAIVYDTKGELLSFHGDLERDGVLNPAHPHFPRWTPWNEIRTPFDAWLIAEAWLPDSGSGEKFWEKAARQMFADILLAIPKGRRTNGELIRVCLHATAEELKELLCSFPSGRLFADPESAKMRESVRNTLTLSLQGMHFLDPSVREHEGFSIRNWVAEVAAKQSGGRLFVGCPPAHAPALTPLIAVFVEVAAASLLDLVPDRGRRFAFVIDEFPTLPPLKFLKRVMSEGRGYGAMVILAAQNHTQIRETYGENGAATICSVCSTQIVFRVNDPESADRASRLLGDAEYDDSRETDGHNKLGGSTSLSSQRSIRRVVMAAEVMSLPKFHAYLKLAGDVPVAEISVSPKSRRKVVADFEPKIPQSYTPPPMSESRGAEPNCDDVGLL